MHYLRSNSLATEPVAKAFTPALFNLSLCAEDVADDTHDVLKPSPRGT